MTASLNTNYNTVFTPLKIKKLMTTALFVPCYVDALYPEVGVATLKLLRALGLDPAYPERQTCCGQPMGNAGFERKADALAEQYDQLFSGYDYVVAPSASCAAYVRLFHPRLLSHPCTAAGRTTDLVEFLHDVLKVKELPWKPVFPHIVSVHNSCHGVRELGLATPSERREQQYNKVRDLLSLVSGIDIREPERRDECCGFGGMFSVEEPAVSTRMGQDKLRRHVATGAEYVTGPDSSCLMHLEGIARKRPELAARVGGADAVRFIHIAQILASGL